MDREILFRGKQKTWIYGGFHKASDGTCYIHTDHETFEVDPKSVGQYSGLEDENGKKIFEGDCYSKDNIVEFSYGSFNINGDVPLDAIKSKISIIGNVYDLKKTVWKEK